MTNRNKQIVEIQLGRKLRSEVKVTTTCHFNLPVVIKVPPNLDDGTPFPTTYWLSCPMYTKKIGSLESKGLIKELDSQIQSDKNLYKQWIGRQQSYEAERNDEIDEDTKIPPYGGVGGARESIKCLHSHFADQLATGKNMVGNIVEELVGILIVGLPASRLHPDRGRAQDGTDHPGINPNPHSNGRGAHPG